MKIKYMFAMMMLLAPSLAIVADVSIPEKYQTISAGGEVFFKVEVRDTETVGRHDIALEYDLMKGGELIASEKSLKAIETQASFMESMAVPNDAEEGAYNIVVHVNGIELASAVFYIEGAQEGSSLNEYMVIIVFTVVIVAILVVYEIDRIRRSVERQSASMQTKK